MNQVIEKEAPRHLNVEQKELIIRILAPFKGQRPGTIVNNSKRENREYLSDLKNVLVAAGWDVYEQGVMISGAEPVGMVITVGEKDSRLPSVQALVRVFEAAGLAPVKFEYQPAADPENKYMFGKIKPGEILLQVGDKP